MRTVPVAMRMLRRNWSAGELRVLLLALLIAVGSVTTVGFFADRVQAALDQQANELLGADLAVIADHRLGPAFGGQERIKTVRSVGYIFVRPAPPPGPASNVAVRRAV